MLHFELEFGSSYREGDNLYRIKQVLDGYGLRVDETGRWHRDTDDVPSG